MKLMIVESPTKAKKIGSLLGTGWRVEASMGHIVDLPTDQMAVEPQTYQLTYVASERGRSVISADSDEAAPLFRDDCAPGFRDDLAPCFIGVCRQ